MASGKKKKNNKNTENSWSLILRQSPFGRRPLFKNEQFGEIRTIIKDNEPWFVGKDVAEVLGYVNPSKAIRMHVDDEDKVGSKMDTSFGIKETTIINESGLYSLILSSKLPQAKEFKKT